MVQGHGGGKLFILTAVRKKRERETGRQAGRQTDRQKKGPRTSYRPQGHAPVTCFFQPCPTCLQFLLPPSSPFKLLIYQMNYSND